MLNTEIISSLRKALENIDRASQAYQKEDEADFDLSLWRAFSEIEYVSFLVSSETETADPVVSKRRRVSEIDIGLSLTEAKNSLLECLKLMENEGTSAAAGDEVEKAKTAVFSAMRKQTRIRQQERSRVSTQTP
jgi:hypothetical protein